MTSDHLPPSGGIFVIRTREFQQGPGISQTDGHFIKMQTLLLNSVLKSKNWNISRKVQKMDDKRQRFAGVNPYANQDNRDNPCFLPRDETFFKIKENRTDTKMAFFPVIPVEYLKVRFSDDKPRHRIGMVEIGRIPVKSKNWNITGAMTIFRFFRFPGLNALAPPIRPGKGPNARHSIPPKRARTAHAPRSKARACPHSHPNRKPRTGPLNLSRKRPLTMQGRPPRMP